MTAEYKFRLKNPAGTLVAEFVDVQSFAYTKEVNGIGMLTLDVPSSHQIVTLLDDALDSIFEVWRRDTAASIDWYCDYRGLYRDEMRQADSDGLVTARCYFPGPLHYLRRPILAYRGGVANRTQWTNKPVETIMHNIVTYNCTSSGTTADGRHRNAALTKISVEANGAYGTSIDYAAQGRKVLDVLQEITRIAPGDFDLVYTGTNQWQYRFYEEQLGTDRTATVQFALQWNNMGEPRYVKNKLNEQTVAICGGQGDEATRAYRVRIPAYSNHDATDNDIEFYVDASQTDVTAEIDAIGDAAIWEMRANSQILFNARQTQALQYGRDYFLGDLVRGYFEGIGRDLKVWGVSVAMDGSGEEQIQVDIRDA